ncbi:MAG: type II secretion system F family protein [Candidatus Aenigmatarchaeota archaeon]
MLKGLATRIFGGLVDKYLTDSLNFLKESLQKADIKIPFRVYLSLGLFLSVLLSFISIPISYFFLSFLGYPIILIAVLLFFIPFLTFLISFFIILFYPHQIISMRKKNIETNLPFVLIHMGSVAESGVPPYMIFKLISYFKEYGEVTKEMEKIVRNIEDFGLDPLSAAREVAKRTPSPALKQVLLGFVSTTESGGNVKEYLKNAGEQALFEWRIKRERFLQQLSTYAEFYTGVLIASPLFIISLFAVMYMIQPTIAGMSILNLMRISVYGIIPVLNIFFLLFLRGVEVEI